MAKALRLILAASDFSRAGERALARAARLASESSARLVLMHAIDVGGSTLFRTGSNALGRRLRSQVERRLRQAAAALRRSHGVRVSVVIERGVSAERIARAARRLRADLVVLGAHGRHTLLDSVLGTTAQRVLRLAAAPVLIVRSAAAAPYEEALLPCDDSPSSHAAVQFACAALPKAHFILANVANVPYEGFLARSGGSVDAAVVARYRTQAQEQARARLAALAASLGLAGRFSIRVARGYVPAQILRMAEELQHGLIVMGAYGHSALAATLLGSVSAHVAAEAPCDVLLVKQPARAKRPRRG